MKKQNYRSNYKFIDSAVLNDNTYIDYLERLKRAWLQRETLCLPQ